MASPIRSLATCVGAMAGIGSQDMESNIIHDDENSAQDPKQMQDFAAP